MAQTRIYSVTGKTTRLVRAASQSQALRHVAQSEFGIRVATQDDIVASMQAGSVIEVAGEEEKGE